MGTVEQPLILVTNDDGIESPALWAAVEGLLPLGEVLVVAPDRDWSGAGRSMPHTVTGRLVPAPREIAGRRVSAYAVDASPALAVIHGALGLAPRCPALVVSGINLGANLGTEVTISGTVGAALEAGACGIPALAVSLETGGSDALVGDPVDDYAAAKSFTQCFALSLLSSLLPDDVQALNLNIPRNATPATPWRLTRLSRRRYFLPLVPVGADGAGRPRYQQIEDPEQAEPDSDIWAVGVDEHVSVTPLSLDLTSRVDLNALRTSLVLAWAHSPATGWDSPRTAVRTCTLRQSPTIPDDPI